MFCVVDNDKKVKVTFFRSIDVDSRLYMREYVARPLKELTRSIYQSMRGDEQYACFRHDDGKVIALDKAGQFVMV